jgi:hypothetical protein
MRSDDKTSRILKRVRRRLELIRIEVYEAELQTSVNTQLAGMGLQHTYNSR